MEVHGDRERVLPPAVTLPWHQGAVISGGTAASRRWAAAQCQAPHTDRSRPQGGPHSLANQADADVGARRQHSAAKAEGHAPQPLPPPAHGGGAGLRHQRHTRKAGAAAQEGAPAKAFSEERQAQQGGEDGAQVEDDGLQGGRGVMMLGYRREKDANGPER